MLTIPKSQGKLEFHVPKSFDADHPSVRFSQLSFDTEIRAHPLASRLPYPTEGPSIQVGGDAFRDLRTRDGMPTTIDDYIYSDDPPLELQVFTFRDATIVTLNYPHCLTDAVGLSALIENWCKVLANRPEDVAPLCETDPLESVGVPRVKGAAPLKDHILHDHIVSGWQLILFGINFVYDLLFGPKMQTSTIFLPQKCVNTLKQRAAIEVRQENNSPFISEGDVIAAWGTRMISLGLGPRCKRSLAMMNVFELRGRLGEVFDRSLAHVQNAFFVLTTLFSVQEAQNLSVGQIALRLRSSMVEQTDEAQVQALVRLQRASIQSAGRPVLFAKPDSILLPFSNWSKARFFDVVDFSPAAIKDSGGGSGQRIGKPAFFLAFDANSQANPTHRNVFNIIGKDPDGNYWITGMLSPATWEKVAKEIALM